MRPDRLEGLSQRGHELVEVELFTGLSNINEVIGNLLPFNCEFIKVLSGSDVQALVNLPGVGADHFAVEMKSQLAGESGLAARGGT